MAVHEEVKPERAPEAEGGASPNGEAHAEPVEHMVLDGDSHDIAPVGAASPSQLGTRRFVYAAYFAGAIALAFLASKLIDFGWLKAQAYKPAIGEPRDEIVMPISALVGGGVAVYYWTHTRARELADEVATEMSKVTWPSRTEVTNGTVVVIVTTVLSTVFFALMDKFWGFVTNLVYGGLVNAMAKKWYVIQAYSGYEGKVKEALLQRIKEHHMEDRFGEVLIPTETVTEARAGAKNRVRQKTSFPGYIFVEMDMSEDVWHIVKDTPKVTGFIGNQRPQEVTPPQIDDLRKSIVEGAVKPKPRVSFETGDEIRVIDGAFANFSGTVEEVKPDKQKLRVKVSIFGRATPVELDFSQVEKRVV